MSDNPSTPTPADVATKQPAAAPQPAQDPPAQEDTTDWKAEARKWEARAKENKTAADTASKTEAEKVADRLAAVEKRAVEAEARVLRREVALEHKLSRDDAALLDTITDEDAMQSLARRLASLESDKKNGNRAPLQGRIPESTGERSSWSSVLNQLDEQRQN